MSDTAAFPPAQVAPGPRYRTIFGWLADFRRDALRFLEDCRNVYGDVAVLRAPPVTGFVLSHPDLIRQVLEKRTDRYWKGRVMGRVARHAGWGILFSDGERWRTGRRLVQPAFTRERLAEIGPPIEAASRALLERWEREDASTPIEVAGEMARLTLDVAGRALFGHAFGERLGPYSEMVTRLLEHANYLINTAYPIPAFVPTRRNRRLWPAQRAIQRAVDELLAARRRDPTPRQDLLALLLAAREDPENAYMTERQLRDECITFLGAGHETTGVALAWTWLLLAQHPQVEARLHQELDRVLGERPPTLADLPGLAFTRCVVDESLRLYPPAWAIGREAYGGDELGGHPVPRGAAIFLSPWVMHRDPRYWDEPERFDPDRFLPGHAKGRPRYAYFPFGGGPRRCIGDQFALLELTLVLATLAQRYRLRLEPGQRIEPYPLFTLRPRYGIRMRREPRRASD